MMRRVLFLLAILLFPMWAYAADGTFPRFTGRLFRSSNTASVDTDVLLSSGNVVIHEIVIASYTVNLGGTSFLQMYCSTGNNGAGTFNAAFDASSGTFLPKMSLNADTSVYPSDHFYDVPCSSYTWYNKQGGATISILWDWFSPADANPRQ